MPMIFQAPPGPHASLTLCLERGFRGRAEGTCLHVSLEKLAEPLPYTMKNGPPETSTKTEQLQN